VNVTGARRPRRCEGRDAPGGAAGRGFTLLEAMVAISIMGVFAVLSVPSFRRVVERAHADLAAANLQSVWVAQRFYRLDHGAYAPDLATLEAAQLVEATLHPASTPYAYAITSADVDVSTFTASATRGGSSVWSGGLTIDQDGQIAGVISDQGAATITPSYSFTGGRP
jgi:type IV pilus assembly protein PilE